MMQCFPVPSNGKMKIRLGITAPLDAEGQLWMPEIIERNFMMGESAKTHLWVQSRTAFDGPPVGTVANGTKGERTWQAAVALNGDPLSFRWNGLSTEPFWSQDPLSTTTDQERVVTGRWEMTPSNARPLVAVVIDGSAPLRPHRAAIADALKTASVKGPVRAWISTDEGARELDPSVPLTDDDFTGGRPALPSLVMAMTHASSVSGGGGILWLRGPQPAEKIEGDEAAMEQIMRFSLNPPVIFSVPVVEGAHRLMEKLYRHPISCDRRRASRSWQKPRRSGGAMPREARSRTSSSSVRPPRPRAARKCPINSPATPISSISWPLSAIRRPSRRHYSTARPAINSSPRSPARSSWKRSSSSTRTDCRKSIHPRCRKFRRFPIAGHRDPARDGHSAWATATKSGRTEKAE